MNDQDHKSEADYARELRERQRLLNPSDFISYPTGDPRQFIKEFSGGRRILIEIDEESGKEHFIKEL